MILIKKKPYNTKSTSEFINDAVRIHSDRYDYSLSVYTTAHDKIKIVCKSHGVFTQTPNDHLTGRGCPHCARNQKRTTEDFIAEATKVHNGFYSYKFSEYINANDHIIVTCPIHGNYNAVARTHLNGRKCKLCSMSNSSKKEKLWLSSLDIATLQTSYKIYSELHQRNFIVDGYDPKTNKVYLFHGDYWHGNPACYSRDRVNKHSRRTMGELYDRTIEYENQLRELGYDLVIMWESEWDSLIR